MTDEAPTGVPRIVWWIMVAALLVRVVALFQQGNYIAPEAWEYGDIADNLLAGKGYAGSAWLVPFGKTAFMAPGYVYLLAGHLLLFGPKGYLLIELLQCAVGAVGCLLGYRIARRIFGEPVGLVAAVLLAVYPTQVYLCTQAHPAAIICVLLLVVVDASLALQEKPSPSRAAWLGGVLGVSLLFEPASICYLPLAVGWPVLTQWRKPRDAMRTLALALAVMIVIVAPWTIRNALVFDEFVLVKSPAGQALWIGNHEGANGAQIYVDDQGNVRHNISHLTEEDRAYLRELGEPEAYRELGRRATAYMRAHPAHTIKMVFKKALYYWWYPTWLTCPRCHNAPWYTQFHHPEKVVWAVVLPLGLLGMILRRREWRTWLPLCFPFVTYTALYSLTTVGSNTRYRLPLEGLMLIFVAVTIVTCASRRDSQQTLSSPFD